MVAVGWSQHCPAWNCSQLPQRRPSSRATPAVQSVMSRHHTPHPPLTCPGHRVHALLEVIVRTVVATTSLKMVNFS